MQYLGEICAAQCSRGLFLQDKNHVKPRKEIQKRSFWRRFFSSFLSLLKEKRPPEANKESDPRRGAEHPFLSGKKVPRRRQKKGKSLSLEER